MGIKAASWPSRPWPATVVDQRSIFDNNLYRFITVYEDVGSNFNPEVGFIERNAIHQYFGQFAYKPRPKFIPQVQQMEFETQIEYYPLS
jgi:hypothetical protein